MELWIPPGIVDDYKDAKFERRPHGIIFVNGKEVAHTLMCPHCGAHFVSMKGSGARRGWCFSCKQVTCGDPRCAPCNVWLDGLQRNMGREF